MLISIADHDSIYRQPILIVDDNDVNRLYIEKVLTSRGFYNLKAVDSAEAALACIDTFNPELLILDILMPGMDGFECCNIIRQKLNQLDLPILIQTAIIAPELRVKAFEHGATDFVSKPVYSDELYARVMVHLEKRLYLKNLQLYKSRVETELESARQLQCSILPQNKDIQEVSARCQLEIASHYQPSSEVGGDFWGMKSLFPHQTALWLIDFSGHGVAAALNSFRLQAYLMEYSPLATRPGDYLVHLNEKLLQLLLHSQFATMFYGILDTRSNELFYSCACSPNPIFLDYAKATASVLDGSGRPLGISLGQYPTVTIPFHAGDVLVLYSDALTETANQDGEFINERQIAHLLSAYQNHSAETIRDAILEEFNQHRADDASDDLTLVVCRRTP